MGRFSMNMRHLLIAGLVLSFAGIFCAPARAQKSPKVTKVKDTPPPKKDATAESAEPDKILYERAQASIKKGRYTEGRLDLQTLINTYPDSEYLAKAKLGVADSFYKEGGTSSLTQAIEEYKNFIVFFPFLDEAAYAQMQVGMAHYKLMEKADRDNSHAEAAEDEFRLFLTKYPQSPYVPQAEQSMRNVQEILAQGEFGIAQFYYAKKDYRASAARLIEVSSRYPLFSNNDEALWMLGEIYFQSRGKLKNEEAKNVMSDSAARCYDNILQNYPGSEYTAQAKERLKSMNMPIPAVNPDALARMKQQQLYERDHRQLALVHKPMEMFKSSPDFAAASHVGQPNLAPPDEIVSATDVLTPTSGAGQFNISNAGASTGGGADVGKAGTVDTESVETNDTAADTAALAAAQAASTPTGTAAAQVVDSNGANTATAGDAAATTPAPAATTDAAATATPVAAGESSSATPAANSATTAQTGASTAQTPAAGSSTGSTASGANQAPAADSSTESTSKKKKGIRKVIPF
jgi:outer membrane protein assembly factor BamD